MPANLRRRSKSRFESGGDFDTSLNDRPPTDLLSDTVVPDCLSVSSIEEQAEKRFAPFKVMKSPWRCTLSHIFKHFSEPLCNQSPGATSVELGDVIAGFNHSGRW